MDIDYREIEQQAGFIDLSTTLEELFNNLVVKEKALDQHVGYGPEHLTLTSELGAAVTAMVAFLETNQYVYREVSSTWSTYPLAIHPLYAEAFDAGHYQLLWGWSKNMGDVARWAVIPLRPPVIDSIRQM